MYLICALILLTSALGWLIGKLHQFLTEISNSRVLSFQVLFISERKNMLLVLIRIAFELRQF